MPNQVLIADDDEHIRKGIAFFLPTGSTYKLDFADSADSALEKVRENMDPKGSSHVLYHLIFTDYHFTEEFETDDNTNSGLYLVRQIRSLDKRVPIIMMSSMILLGDFVKKLREAGVTDYIHKPIRGPDVHSVYRKHARQFI